MRILLGSMALVSVIAASVPVRSAEPTAAELAQSLQRKYDTIRDFSADFVHNYRSGALKKQVTEKGRLLIKKPGKMRWEYTAPEPKLFVSDGVKIYSYIPQDKQVVVSSVPPDDTASGPALFLAGKGNLLRDFTTSFAEVPAGMPPGTKALKLVPRKPQPDYDWIVLLVDQTTLGLRGLMSADAQGGTSTFSFANLKENVNLADKEFAFQMPRGVDVVTDAGQK
ncbi:MAG TPA: outer membrane lipoprotein carrier protein LolA [Vicinamibacterales bacterium]